MEKTEAHRLPRVVLNERRRRAVKLRLNGATIAETVMQCELGRLACPVICTSEIVSVAQLSLISDSRRRGCGEVGSA